MSRTIVKTDRVDSVVGTIRDHYYDQDGAYGARPYIDAILDMPEGATAYGHDDLHGLLMYLISNIRGWRGPVAKECKQELRFIIAGL